MGTPTEKTAVTHQLYTFLIKRPHDREAWPTVWRDLDRATQCEWRASDVYQVTAVEKQPVNVPKRKRSI